MCKIFCEVKLSEKDHIFRKTGIIQKEILLKGKRWNEEKKGLSMWLSQGRGSEKYMNQEDIDGPESQKWRNKV